MKWTKGITVSKDPDAVIDWKWDFGGSVDPWLATGDSLSAHVVTADTGITVDSSSISGDQVIVWLSGGTAGISYDVTVNVTTADGRKTDWTVIFEVSEQ